VLVAEGGAAVVPDPGGRDPFEVLDDLMSVVEALCPSWPPRPAFSPMRHLRL
jgi:hypothetical protein